MADEFTVASFSDDEIFELAHAGVTGHGHFESDALDLSVRNDAKEIWYIFLANRTRWHHVVQFFKRLNLITEMRWLSLIEAAAKA